MKRQFVIRLSSESISSPECYGYWRGKDYAHDRELFPITDDSIMEQTKIYTTKARAERGLKACLNRSYAYVTDGWIEEKN